MKSFIISRKSFIILLVICSATFFLYGFYVKPGDSYNAFLSTNNIYQESDEYNPSTEAQFFQKLRIELLETTIKPQVRPTLDRLKYEEYLKLFYTRKIPNDDENLNSGPTEFAAFDATASYKKDNEEELFSGPTEFEDSPMTRKITEPTFVIKGGTKSSETTVNTFERKTQSEETNQTKNSAMILDTPGCRIPKFDPWDITVKDLYVKQSPYECPGPPLFMKPHPDGSIALNSTVLEIHYKMKPEQLSCSYKSIFRKHESSGAKHENSYGYGDLLPLKFGISLNEDYVVVTCKMAKQTFEQYFPLVRLKDNVEKERSKRTPPDPKLNVILAGIDSVSKLNFLRHFPRTHAFLKEKISPFEMKGYTKVGDNTFPNLVPMLTGHFVEYYWNETVKDTYTFDGIDHIWKEYANRGYRTFYAEDSPYTGTFNYLKRGFHDPPTDYYLRPVAMALEGSELRKKSKSHCLHSQLETDFIYDYLRNFVEAMSTKPYIAFAMVSTLTHDYLNNAGLADEPAVRLLEDLLKSGALENSMLVIFSDHGLRFGKIRETYIGKFEERMPFMYIHFPKWFLKKYPDIAQNLRKNQERLMTLFDVHATMIHLLDLNNKTIPTEVTMGSSLLNELSPNRTCDKANILPHWCPCQTFGVVPLDANTTIKAAQSIVDDINEKLLQFKDSCAVLEIDKIIDARLGQASDLVMRFVKHQNDVIDRKVVLGDKIDTFGDYLMTLTTKPGGAVFEGTVRYNLQDDSYSVLGISRINMYGNQSKCIDSQKMKIFCYCKS